MRLRALALVFLLSWTYMAAAGQRFVRVPLVDPVQDKNFYLLSLFESDPAVRSAIVADPGLAAMANARRGGLASGQRACKGNAACLLKGFLWTDEEFLAVGRHLHDAAATNPALKKLIAEQLRPSSAYVLYSQRSDGELIENAWLICARGLNQVISVYGLGEAPRYPVIDSMSVDPKSAELQQKVAELAKKYAAPEAASAPVFESSLRAAMALLTLNHRDEAGRFEPMESGVNRAALQIMAKTNWEKYLYSVIMIPGAGPEDRETILSEAGRRRCQMGADAYRAGKAPFVMPSGGYVHPSQTRYAEAAEMKKALMEMGVPESAILMEPHARHTTTNVRNAAREIFRYGMAVDKPMLVVSDAAQIKSIASRGFVDRCLREFGYVPYKMVKLESPTAVSLLPLRESLQQDPIDPLDP